MRTKKLLFLTTIAILLLSLPILVFFAPSCKKKRDQATLPYLAPWQNLSPDAFALVFTSSLEGYVEPCGCTSNPLGGIARFATVFNDIKTTFNQRISLIDSGNLLFDSPTRNEADRCQDEARINLLLTTLTGFGLQTTLTGPLDDAHGVKFRDATYDKYHLSPLSSKSFDVRVIKTPSFNIGVIGFDSHDKLTDNIKKQLSMTIQNASATHSLKMVVALSQLPVARTKEFFHDFKEIDVIIQGLLASHDPSTPVLLGKTGPVLVQASRQGQYFSLLVLENLSKRKSERLLLDTRANEKTNRQDLLTTRIAALNKQASSASGKQLDFIKERIALAEKELNELERTGSFTPITEPLVAVHNIPLTKKIESDPIVKKALDAFEKSIPSLVKQCEASIECKKPSPQDPVYVGATVCKGCHQEAFTVWQQAIVTTKTLDEEGKEISRLVGHSRAWQTLVDGQKDKDRTCIGCHSIGFMEPGGYCKAYEVDFRKDVQCESCHGAGSLHAQSGEKKFIKRNVDEATCRKCHHVPHIANFDSFNFDEKVVKILGKGHGEKLLQEITHRAKQTTP